MSWLASEIGYAVCHQMPERALHYGGRALPACARDTGLFVGFALTFAALLAVYGKSGGRRPSWKVTVVLVALLVPTVVDAVTSYAGWRESTNFIRLLTGALAGTAGAALVFPLTCELAFGEKASGVVLPRARSVMLLLVVPVAISFTLAAGWPGAFYPFWSALLVLSILFTLLVLNYTLVSLVAESVRHAQSPPSYHVIALLAAAAVVIELVLSNRLHWLVDRVL